MANELSQDEINQLLATIRPDSPDEKTFPREDITVIEGDLSGKKEFPGAVLIRGRILPGSYIRTEGVLTAEGGITGAEIHAAGGVNAPFAEMSTLICGNDILITSHLLSCYVRCAGGIYCSAGSFIRGGSCRAYYTVQADVFGHASGAETVIELVTTDPELETPFDREKRGDSYHRKLVALKKVWKGTLISLYGKSFAPRKDYKGPLVLGLNKGGIDS